MPLCSHSITNDLHFSQVTDEFYISTNIDVEAVAKYTSSDRMLVSSSLYVCYLLLNCYVIYMYMTVVNVIFVV